MIATENIRIMPDRHGEAQILRFDARDPKTGWRTVLSHRAGNKHRPWEKEEAYSVEDLEVAPSNSGSTSIFTETDARDPALLIRRGAIGGHRIEERITVESGNRLRVEVRDQLTGPDVCLARLMNHYYFVPDGRAMGYALPLDFAWIPGLHDHENHVAGEWFFRSPCVIVSAHGLYAVIVPDLDLMQEQPDLPHALDLRAWHHRREWRDLWTPAHFLWHMQMETGRPRADRP